MSSRIAALLQQTAAGKKDGPRVASVPVSGSSASPAGKKGQGLFSRLAGLYARMEQAYDAGAQQAGLTCKDCATNCCTSFFQHHTYVEWSYLWRGLQSLPPAQRKTFVKRAEQYVEEMRANIAMNILPTAMCPVNDKGLCTLYPYRLMICRMHGTRNRFSLPNGQQQEFPGCVRFTELPGAASLPALDRTPFYKELAALELEFHQKAGRPLPRVNLTLAEMIVLGPPGR